MKNLLKIYRIATVLLWLGALVAVVIIFMVSLSGCSSARKSMSESSMSVDSIVYEEKSSEVYEEHFTEQSQSEMEISLDSVKFYPLRFSPVSEIPPDSAFKPSFFPACAAALYGVRLNIANADSSSLLLARASDVSESATSFSEDVADSEAEEQKPDRSSPSMWGIMVFIFLILAAILGMRYLDK